MIVLVSNLHITDIRCKHTRTFLYLPHILMCCVTQNNLPEISAPPLLPGNANSKRQCYFLIVP